MSGITLQPTAIRRRVESPARLTRRQAEVLEFAELQRRDIAKLLGISENTVKTHLKRAYEALGVETRAGAVVALRRAA